MPDLDFKIRIIFTKKINKFTKAIYNKVLECILFSDVDVACIYKNHIIRRNIRQNELMRGKLWFVS